ncbi:hypothetical protein GM30_05560 [Trabulsiella odontotermitis]|nr:hypothetical protein GM30_05560 [Trabulsiella odontotermitis]
MENGKYVDVNDTQKIIAIFQDILLPPTVEFYGEEKPLPENASASGESTNQSTANETKLENTEDMVAAENGKELTVKDFINLMVAVIGAIESESKKMRKPVRGWHLAKLMEHMKDLPRACY